MGGNFFSQAGFLQFEIVFGNPAANLEKVAGLLAELAPEQDALLVLPELWAYGFDYEHAETLARQTPSLLQELTQQASRWGVLLAGSLLEKESDGKQRVSLYNTLYVIGPDGVLGGYRKQHLFTFWQEDKYFSPGGFFSPVSSAFGMIGGLICYDLRFPESLRQQVFQGAQLIVVSAEWPKSRIDHWRVLLRARAVENQVFVIACNSCGKTAEHVLGGNSMVVGPDGTILLEACEDEKALVCAVSENALHDVRSKFCPSGERPRPVCDKDKILDLSSLLVKLGSIRQQQSRVAFTNGCFDILHSGHVAYLEQARSTADCLVVGLNSDRSVRAIKGSDRPVSTELERARVLSSLACVDYVVIFDEETPCNLINAILPDILVKGADWAEEDIVGAPEVKAAGGKVVRVVFEHDVSTSGLIARIQTRG